MPILTQTVSPALTLHLLHSENYRTSGLAVHFLTELSEETASHIALLHQVLIRGCEGYPNLSALRQRQDELWGATIYPISEQNGEISGIAFAAAFADDRFLPGHAPVLDGILDLLHRLIFCPLIREEGFLPEVVESERAHLIAYLENENNKKELARYHMELEMFRGQRFSVCADGEVSRVKEITPEELYRFYQSFLKTARVDIFYCGPRDADEMTRKLTHAFPGFDHTPPVLTIPHPGDYLPHPPNYVREIAPVEQGQLCIGVRLGSNLLCSDFDACLLMLEILGRSPINRLYVNVREKKGLCYACSVAEEAYQGFFRIECGIDSHRVDEAVSAIFTEIDEMKEGKISQEELTCAKKSLISYFRGIPDDSGDLMGWYTRLSPAGLTDSPHDFAQKIQAVDLQQVILTAKSMVIDTVFFLCEKGAEDGSRLSWKPFVKEASDREI
ncbi:MAG: M16 family metallopeptidase [Eubacteriales bacterium]